MDVIDLRCFLTVAKHLSFTRAAEELSMSTSPLSRRIKALERRLCVQLFLRSSHDVQLTPAGRALLDRAKVVVDLFDGLVEGVRDAPSRELVFGFVAATPPAIADRALKVLSESPSRTAVRCHFDMTGQLLTGLSRGTLDLACLHGPVAPDLLGFHSVLIRHLGVVVPSGSELAAGGYLTSADLVGSRFVFPPRYHAPAMYRRLFQKLRGVGVEAFAEIEEQDPLTLASRVRHSGEFALSALCADLHSEIYRSRGLTVLPVADLELTVELGFAWSLTHEQTDADLAVAIECLAAAFDQPLSDFDLMPPLATGGA